MADPARGRPAGELRRIYGGQRQGKAVVKERLAIIEADEIADAMGDAAGE